jgi:hypothetical protein
MLTLGGKRTSSKVAVTLRTGKILAAKASASHMRSAVGVTHSDELRAAKALTYAAAKPTGAKSVKNLSRAASSKSRSLKS